MLTNMIYDYCETMEAWNPPSYYCSLYVHIGCFSPRSTSSLCIEIEKNILFFQELEDSFNYGLFQPPLNGRAGKFLDEERRLAEYPFQGSVGHLEVFFIYNFVLSAVRVGSYFI